MEEIRIEIRPWGKSLDLFSPAVKPGATVVFEIAEGVGEGKSGKYYQVELAGPSPFEDGATGFTTPAVKKISEDALPRPYSFFIREAQADRWPRWTKGLRWLRKLRATPRANLLLTVAERGGIEKVGYCVEGEGAFGSLRVHARQWTSHAEVALSFDKSAAPGRAVEILACDADGRVLFRKNIGRGISALRQEARLGRRITVNLKVDFDEESGGTKTIDIIAEPPSLENDAAED